MEDDSVKSAEYCWARVNESELMAAKAIDPKRKAVFEEIAIRWRRLAEESMRGALKPVGESSSRRLSGDLNVGSAGKVVIDRQMP